MLAVASENADAARQVLDERWHAALGEEGRRADAIVVDLEAAETTCPACMTVFDPTGSGGRCPDCGLAFA